MSNKEKAIFLDRDGTIIKEVNFLSIVEETELFSYTIEALSLLSTAGFRLFVTTNQSGISRGYFGASAVNAIHSKIQSELAQANIKIDGFFFCPHFPDDGCRCRKPNIGMIEQAANKFELDLDSSWMIGDKELDIGMGFNANTQTALVLTGYGAEHKLTLSRKPDLISENLLEAAKSIVNS
jgi:D-glycero-D-manno-heptose 1,7-bisphosphate phosphatase